MRLIKFRTEDQAVTALVGDPERIYTKMVYIDAPIRLRKIPNGDVERYGNDVQDKRPTVKQAARRMLRVGKSLGITKGAKKFLRQAVKS